MNTQKPQYNIYPSLLDTFAGYINSSQVYQDYYGFAEEPAITEAEFEQKKYEELIDKINRVPFESEPADKGTMFNEVIDCIVEYRKSNNMEIKALKETVVAGDISGSESDAGLDEVLEGFVNPLHEIDLGINVKWKDRSFTFNTADCKALAKAVKGAVCQDYQEAFLQTKYGVVKIYGYSDYLLPFRVVDLKTTSKYTAFKFRNNWQHIVYPFLLHFNGNFISDFTYLVYKWTRNGGEIFEEEYTYDETRDLPKLTDFIEQFIEFLEENRAKIKDKKIFNLQKQMV